VKRYFIHSFRLRVFLSFLGATLLPVLLCSGILLQTFRVRMTSEAAEEAQGYLDRVSACLDQLDQGIRRCAGALGGDSLIADALAGDAAADTAVYSRLFAATVELRGYARFDLYDAGGTWRYSTQAPPAAAALPTDWGVLGLAGGPGELVYSATVSVSDAATAQLQAVSALSGPGGERVGYLVTGVYQNHFRLLLEDKYGSQNDLLILSRYWRPVYCAQPSLAAALAPRLRALLLSGQSLNAASDEFSYSVLQHPATGLYAVLRQPQVFTRDTMGLLYTVSATCALICVALSVVMSLVLSRQLSLPVSRLTQAVDRVGRDELDVQVPPERSDELGELTEGFNHMVSALKRNREALVENQRELTRAQIRMLQAQLNPHFLCNTLDTMKWISKINKVPQVAEMSASLADILRYAISPDEFVPLWRDEEILERYVDIQTVRLSGGFTFAAEIPVELSDCLVPKLLLQPMVENAILHGLEGVEDGGVLVTAREEGGVLVLTVEDNGKGFPPDLLGAYSAQTAPEGHLGLFNINTILKKYYGADFGLTLRNRPGGGAAVTARLPVRREEEPPC